MTEGESGRDGVVVYIERGCEATNKFLFIICFSLIFSVFSVMFTNSFPEIPIGPLLIEK